MRLLITAALCFTATTATTATTALAQSAPTSPIARGSRIIGGSASLTRSTVENGGSESSVTSINVSPRMLWFIRDRLAVGGEVGLGSSSGDGASSSSWRLGPAVQWYFADLNERTLPFLGASLFVGSTSAESGGTDFTTTAQGLELTAGATRLLARNVGITGELFATRRNTASESGTITIDGSTTNLGVRFGVSAFLY